MENIDIAHTLDRSHIIAPNKLASYCTKDKLMVGVIVQSGDRIDKAFSIQLNKELAEYLYNCLSTFLGKSL